MSAAASIPPKYNSDLVEPVLLEEVIELLPIRLTVFELCQRIAADPHDERAIETIKQATGDLRRWGLLRYRNDDELVEPTQAALRAFELLTR